MYLDNTKYLRSAGDDARRCLPHHGSFCRACAAGSSPCCARRSRSAISWWCRASFSRMHCVRARLFDTEGVAPGAIVHPTAEIEDGVDDRPGRGDRPARGDRFGDRDRRDRGDRAGRSDRPRLLGRSGRLDHACADRRQRHRCTPAAASGRTGSATTRAPRATSRFRSSAGSSSRTTSRSAPTPRSIAAAAATP